MMTNTNHRKVKKSKKQKKPKKKDVSQTSMNGERLKRKERKRMRKERMRKAREKEELAEANSKSSAPTGVEENEKKRKERKRTRKERKRKAMEIEELAEANRNSSALTGVEENEKKRKMSDSDVGEYNNVHSSNSTNATSINNQVSASGKNVSMNTRTTSPIANRTNDAEPPSDELLIESVDRLFNTIDVSAVKVSQVYSMLEDEFSVSMKGHRGMIKKRLSILISNTAPKTKNISIRKRAIVDASKMLKDNDHDVSQYATGDLPNRKIYLPSVAIGYTDPIAKDEIEKHEKKGFVWVKFNGRYSCDEEWNIRFRELRGYKEKHGDCLVPQHYSDNRELGAWCAKQRHEYKLLLAGKSTALSDIRVKLLESEGFIWAVHEKLAWQERFEQLIQYKANYGDCNVPQHYEKSRELGLWVAEQRRQYSNLMQGKKSSMTESKVVLLEAQGFFWSLHKGSWQQRLNELQEFRREHGHCRVPASHENKKLARWVSYQRAQYKYLMDGKKSQLTKGKIKSLIALGFAWNLHRKISWEDRLKELITFRDDHKHCDIPRDYESNTKLAAW